MDELINAQKEIEAHKEEVIQKLLQFALTDTLVFWGTEKDLIKEQKKVWGPILKWADDALKMNVKTTDTLEVPQENKQTGHRIKTFLDNLSIKELTAFYKSALLMKSVLLAMAFVKGQVNAKQAFEASLLEERWQNQIWGATEETQEEQDEFLQELQQIEVFLNA